MMRVTNSMISRNSMTNMNIKQGERGYAEYADDDAEENYPPFG